MSEAILPVFFVLGRQAKRAVCLRQNGLQPMLLRVLFRTSI